MKKIERINLPPFEEIIFPNETMKAAGTAVYQDLKYNSDVRSLDDLYKSRGADWLQVALYFVLNIEGVVQLADDAIV